MVTLKDIIFGKACTTCKTKRTKNESGICNECLLEEERSLEAARIVFCPICRTNEMKLEELKIGCHIILIRRCDMCDRVFFRGSKIRKIIRFTQKHLF